MGSFLIEPTIASPLDPNFDFGVSRFQSVRELTVGAGNQVAKTDKFGSFWGNAKRVNASALINNDGSAVFKNIQVSGLQAGSSVNGAYLQALSVLASSIADNAVTETKISSDAVTSPKIAANAVVAAKIAAGQITATHVGTNTIIANAANIADAIITSAKIASLNADVIIAGTITGRTLKANNGGGVDIWVQNDGTIRFYYGSTERGYLYCDTGGNVLMHSSSGIYLTSNGAGDNIFAHGDLVTLVSNTDITNVFNDDGGSDSARWVNDTSLTMEHRDSGDLAIAGMYL